MHVVDVLRFLVVHGVVEWCVSEHKSVESPVEHAIVFAWSVEQILSCPRNYCYFEESFEKRLL